MKVLKFKGNKPEWSIPLNELSADIKRQLLAQLNELIHALDEAESASDQGDLTSPSYDRIEPKVIIMMERAFGSTK